MNRIELQRVAGASAILYVVLIIVFMSLFLSSDAIDAEGAAEFLPILDENKEISVILSGLLMIMPLLIAIAGIGIFQMLQHSGSLTWIAVFGFAGGGVAILYRGFTWMAMTLELAPAYVEADADEKTSLAAVGDTLEAFALGADFVGAALVAGIGVLVFAVAMLQRNIGPRWLAWSGIFGAIIGGWLTLLIPVSEVIEAITLIGSIGFWIWITGVGVIMWRNTKPTASETQIPV